MIPRLHQSMCPESAGPVDLPREHASQGGFIPRKAILDAAESYEIVEAYPGKSASA